MNNITFGNEKGGYYETVGGGAGKLRNFYMRKKRIIFKGK